MSKNEHAVKLGRLGGLAKSEAKTLAARQNASGRPKGAKDTQPRARRRRYCELCDVWVQERACPACGGDTRPAQKEARS